MYEQERQKLQNIFGGYLNTSMLRIIEYIGDRDFEEFKNNTMVVDAVVRNFEIIGEASNNLPDEIKDKYPEIPWHKMYE